MVATLATGAVRRANHTKVSAALLPADMLFAELEQRAPGMERRIAEPKGGQP